MIIIADYEKIQYNIIYEILYVFLCININPKFVSFTSIVKSENNNT